MTILAAASTTRFVALTVPAWAWAAMLAVIMGLLLADLLVVHRTPHEISVRAALIESAVWVGLAMAFGLVVGLTLGWPAAGEWYGGYLIEESLSVGNVFVWAVIMGYFRVPARFQYRVLFAGIFGALVLRAIFIFAGVALLDRFTWLLYVFGALLLVAAVRMLRGQDVHVDPGRNPVLRAVRRVIPSTDQFEGQRMFTLVDGVRRATPLLAVLVLVELTDVVFAADSVPAILAVSREPFLVFSSNAFAILGLPAMHYALAGMRDRLRHLHAGLAAILAFLGVKMLLLEVMHVPTGTSLAVIIAILAITVTASLVRPLEGTRR